MSQSSYSAFLPALLLLPVLAWACGDGSPLGPVEEIEGLPRSLSVNEEILVEASNDFAFRLLDQVYGEAPDSSLFLSPLSASMALGMTMNGAVGTTFDEMRSTLGFHGMTMGQVNEGFRDLIDLLLNLDATVEMGIGNSIWYRQGFPVNPDFLARTQDYFDAEVAALDFSDPGAAGTINNWVKGRTKDRIEEIVDDPINPATVMFLINAIYFKGSWSHRFDGNKTVQAAFTSEGGASGQLPIMELVDTLLYAETDEYQVVDLPYGGKAFSMTVLLPREGATVRELVSSLDPTSWGHILSGMNPREGTVYLPRFRMEWGKVLNETLQAMGMVTPFVGGLADFSGMVDSAHASDLFISKVKQKSYVDVNEEGTEASAVTVVEMRKSSTSDHFLFRADRPFLFVIRERFSETILFAGVLARASGQG